MPLAQSDAAARQVFEELLDPLVLVTPVSEPQAGAGGYRLDYANPAACQEAWTSAEELLEAGLDRALPGFSGSSLPQVLARVAATGEPHRQDRILLEGSQAGRRLSRLLDLRVGRAGEHLFVTWRDVTGRAHVDRTLGQLTRTRAILAATGRAIARIRDRGRLLAEVCRIAVEEGGLRMAWVGLVAPESGALRPAASKGYVHGYLEGLQINTVAGPESQGPTATALRLGRPIVCNDIALDPRMSPWRDRALERGYAASAAFPLRVEGRIIGSLNLYASETEAFHREEVDLLDAMAEDLSFALQALEQDERKREAERALADTKELLERALEEFRLLNHELEERVRSRTAELEEAVRDLEAFSRNVSHDLRSPLQLISGCTSVLTSCYSDELPADALGLVDQISIGVDRMSALIDDLLAFSRSGRAALNLAEVDLDALVREVVEELRRLEPIDRVLEVTVGELGKVRGDPALLRQLAANLVGNAFKYSRPVQGARVEIGREGDSWFVRDNGVGFDPSKVDRLFQPFVRLHPHDSFEGTGLGLAIVRRVARRHGGDAWAESAPGQGTIVRFTLPQE